MPILATGFVGWPLGIGDDPHAAQSCDEGAGRVLGFRV